MFCGFLLYVCRNDRVFSLTKCSSNLTEESLLGNSSSNQTVPLAEDLSKSTRYTVFVPVLIALCALTFLMNAAVAAAFPFIRHLSKVSENDFAHKSQKDCLCPSMAMAELLVVISMLLEWDCRCFCICSTYICEESVHLFFGGKGAPDRQTKHLIRIGEECL